MKSPRIAVLSLVALLPGFAPGQSSADREAAWKTVALKSQQQVRAGNFAEAATTGLEALQLAKRFGPWDTKLAATYYLLGVIHRDWGHCAEARANYLHALAIWRHLPEPNPRFMFNTMSNLISSMCECDDFVAAEKTFRAYESDLRRYRGDALDDAKVLALRAMLAGNKKEYPKAEALMRQAIDLMEHSSLTSPTDLAAQRSSLAVMLDKQHRYQESLVESQHAIAFFEEHAPSHPSMVAALNNAACSLASLGREEESERMFQSAMALAEKIYGEENHVVAKIMLSYARVLRDNKQTPAAEVWHKRGAEAYRRSLVRNAGTVDVEELRTAKK